MILVMRTLLVAAFLTDCVFRELCLIARTETRTNQSSVFMRAMAKIHNHSELFCLFSP